MFFYLLEAVLACSESELIYFFFLFSFVNQFDKIYIEIHSTFFENPTQYNDKW